MQIQKRERQQMTMRQTNKQSNKQTLKNPQAKHSKMIPEETVSEWTPGVSPA
jgi:hypothetical protein